MAEEFQPIQQDPINSLLSEFGTRLNEIEEKQRLIKDRVLFVGENLISTKEDFEKERLEVKDQIKKVSLELKSIKQLMERIVNELGNFARKTELEILYRQTKMFKPLKFTTPDDVRKIIRQEK